MDTHTHLESALKSSPSTRGCNVSRWTTPTVEATDQIEREGGAASQTLTDGLPMFFSSFTSNSFWGPWLNPLADLEVIIPVHRSYLGRYPWMDGHPGENPSYNDKKASTAPSHGIRQKTQPAVVNANQASSLAD